MNRFKQSKYRNLRLTEAKREDWYSELQVGDTAPHFCGIAASATAIAFPSKTSGGGAVTILSLDAPGKVGGDAHQLMGHGGPISALAFSPFNDNFLATGSDDNTVKLWEIPEGGLTKNTLSPTQTIGGFGHRVTNVLFHPHAENLLAVSCQSSIYFYDALSGEKKSQIDVPAVVHSLSWSGNGDLLAVTAGDSKIRLYNRSGEIVQEGESHDNKKTSCVLYHPSQNKIITTGFSRMRMREFKVFDPSDLSRAVDTVSLDSGSNLLMPMVDAEADVFWISGKGDGALRTYIFNPSGKPVFAAGETYNSSIPHVGMCSVPKRAMDVMQCEVSRLLRLTKDAVVPVSGTVPRKSYREFADDLFPLSKGTKPGCACDEWLSGSQSQAPLISLDPSKGANQVASPSVQRMAKQESQKATEAVQAPAPKVVTSEDVWGKKEKEKVVVEQRVLKTVKVVRSSKFRHINGVVRHKNNNIEGITALNVALPNDSELLASNDEFTCYPMSGPGGQIAVIPWKRGGPKDNAAKPIRLTDKPTCINNVSPVLDFSFAPYDPHLLVSGCEDATVKVWKIPSGGYSSDVAEPEITLKGHNQKVNIVRFHPVATDVVVSTGYDNVVNVWDLASRSVKYSIDLPQSVSSLAFSANGNQMTLLCRDQMLRVVDLRSGKIIKETGTDESTRGGRVIYLGNTGRILTTGFGRGSQRQVKIYELEPEMKEVACFTYDISPAILVPIYQEGTGIVFLSARGGTSVHMLETCDEEPYGYQLSPYTSTNIQLSICPLPILACDIANVEILRTLKLVKDRIEIIGFTVPRTAKTWFQDDLFPPQAITWKSYLSGNQWFSGEDAALEFIDLCPPNMKPVSEKPEEIKVKKYEPPPIVAEEKKGSAKDNLMDQMSQVASENVNSFHSQIHIGGDEEDWSDDDF